MVHGIYSNSDSHVCRQISMVSLYLYMVVWLDWCHSACTGGHVVVYRSNFNLDPIYIESLGYFNHSCIPFVCMTREVQGVLEQSAVEKIPSFVKLVSPFRKPINQHFWWGLLILHMCPWRFPSLQENVCSFDPFWLPQFRTLFHVGLDNFITTVFLHDIY